MSTSSFKKISAAAIAAVIGFSGMAHAAPITLPYITNFSTTPDSNGDTYTGGNASLYGQAPGTGTGTTGWVSEIGESQDVATVNNSASAGSVTLGSATNGGTFNAPNWSDVYNSNLADHPNGAYPVSGHASNGNGVVLNPSGYNNNITVSGNVNISSLGDGTAGFGLRVLDEHDDLLASVFESPSATPGVENVYAQTGTNEAIIGQTPSGIALAGAIGSSVPLAIHLDFANNDFQVFANGVQSADIPFDTADGGYTPLSDVIGGITFATDNLGTNTAAFSNFSVVPEPASFAMIGLGGLMLLAKRPKKRLA